MKWAPYTPGGFRQANRLCSGAAVVIMLLAGAHSQLCAQERRQQKLAVTPFFASFYSLAAGGAIPDRVPERTLPGPAVGGRLYVPLPVSFGFEASAAYVWSGIKFEDTDIGTAPGAVSGNMFIGSMRIRIQPPWVTKFHFLAGVGVIARGGEAWDIPGATGRTDLMAVLGFGVPARVANLFALHFGVEAHLYRYDLDGDGPFEGRFQQDIMVSVGIPITAIRADP